MESSKTTQEEDENSNQQRGASIEREVMSHKEESAGIRKKRRKFSQGKMSGLKIESKFNFKNKTIKEEIETQKKMEESIAHPDLFYETYDEVMKIGEGAHGVVYLVKKKETGDFYACKNVSSRDTEIIKNQKKEFMLLKMLDHPNIIKAYEFLHDEKRGKCRIITEYVKCENLGKLIQERGPLKEQVSAKIFRKLAEAVHYLHSVGLCHRDIKPDNILTDESGNIVKILDFGISRPFKIRKKAKVNKNYIKKEVRVEMWTPTGTHFYKAPEMLQGETSTEKVDIWALGITLYQMMTGNRPFVNARMDALLYHMKKGNLNLSNGIWNDVHITLKVLLKKLLQFNPQDRISAFDLQKEFWILYWDIQTLSKLPRMSMQESILHSNNEKAKLLPKSQETKKNFDKMNSSVAVNYKGPVPLDHSKTEVSLIMGHSVLMHSYAGPVKRTEAKKLTLTKIVNGNDSNNNSLMMFATLTKNNSAGMK